MSDIVERPDEAKQLRALADMFDEPDGGIYRKLATAIDARDAEIKRLQREYDLADRSDASARDLLNSQDSELERLTAALKARDAEIADLKARHAATEKDACRQADRANELAAALKYIAETIQTMDMDVRAMCCLRRARAALKDNVP